MSSTAAERPGDGAAESLPAPVEGWMITRVVRGLLLWLLLSLPVGVVAGGALSARYGEGAEVDRLTSAVNGALAGAAVAVLGALAAAVTNAVAHDRLRAAGGSELVTGAIVSYGLIAISLALLLLAG